MSQQDQVAEIELNIKQAKDLVDLGKSLDRLEKNKDFKKLILEGYFKEEAIRLVQLKGHPAMQGEDKQTGIVKQMDAIGCLLTYFQKVQHIADNARKAIEDNEQALEEIAHGEYLEGGLS